eukprot:TRINITY_DN8726_c0_g2_i1.p1 TRINITY_DN8726_c0_g2~~TRINITY_DN8726_c0_g2_i1.p1  ORF type:complete len:398 (+),score=71.75 TRINITY_DN8726_c0_g2_i1:88-1194(+)
MAQASLQGIRAARPDKRPFLLTRASFLGGQRYAATWTGDNGSNWLHLGLSIPMCLNLGLSGQPFSGPDIGGFFDDATPSLWARWIGIGAYLPFCRGHTHHDSKDHEPWSFGQRTEKIARISLQRRYALIPYYYTLFREASLCGLPVVRPLFFLDPIDVDLRNEDRAFLLGDCLLIIANVYKSGEEKSDKIPNPNQTPETMELFLDPPTPIALPTNHTWYDLTFIWEDATLIANLQTELAQLKIRAGSIIPMQFPPLFLKPGKVVSTEFILLVALNDEGKANGYMYEDEGDGYGYREGVYLESTFSAFLTEKNITVLVRHKGEFGKRNRTSVHLHVITSEGRCDVAEVPYSENMTLEFPFQRFSQCKLI